MQVLSLVAIDEKNNLKILILSSASFLVISPDIFERQILCCMFSNIKYTKPCFMGEMKFLINSYNDKIAT